MGFSTGGALGGAASGAKLGSFGGPIGIGVGAVLGGALGGFAGGGGSKNSTAAGANGAAVPGGVNPYNALSPEQWAAVMRNQDQYTQGLEQVYGTPVSVGGTQVTQTSRVSDADQKRQAFIQFRLSKGDSLEQATQKANAILADPNIKFKDKKGFVNAINKGNYEGLSIGKDGRIAVAPKYIGGGVETPGISEAMQGALKNLGLESILSGMGQAPMFAADNASAFGLRNDIRGQLGQLIGATGSEGLSARDLEDIDATLNFRKQQLGDLNQKNTAGVVGDLIDRGFMSSNLAEGALQHGVYDPQARFLSDLGSELAGMELNMRNSAANRKSQAVGNAINAFQSAGSPYQIGSILGGVIDPSSAGLFDDVSGAYLGNQIQQQNINNRQDTQAQTNAIGLTPKTIVPKIGGGLGTNMAQSGLGQQIWQYAQSPQGQQAIAEYAPMVINGIKTVAGKIKS